VNSIQAILVPVSLLYGIVVSIRNLCFDLKILPGTKYKKPIISVGNLCTGGAGKTPQVEYLIRLLLENSFKVAILSRGYKRKTKGFFHAGPKTSIEELGDEAWQINNKFNKNYLGITMYKLDEETKNCIKEAKNILKKEMVNVKYLLN